MVVLGCIDKLDDRVNQVLRGEKSRDPPVQLGNDHRHLHVDRPRVVDLVRQGVLSREDAPVEVEPVVRVALHPQADALIAVFTSTGTASIAICKAASATGAEVMEATRVASLFEAKRARQIMEPAGTLTEMPANQQAMDRVEEFWARVEAIESRPLSEVSNMDLYLVAAARCRSHDLGFGLRRIFHWVGTRRVVRARPVGGDIGTLAAGPVLRRCTSPPPKVPRGGEADFPAPVAELASGRIWHREDVEKWARKTGQEIVGT
jgi:hypothetical protein